MYAKHRFLADAASGAAIARDAADDLDRGARDRRGGELASLLRRGRGRVQLGDAARRRLPLAEARDGVPALGRRGDRASSEIVVNRVTPRSRQSCRSATAAAAAERRGRRDESPAFAGCRSVRVPALGERAPGPGRPAGASAGSCRRGVAREPDGDAARPVAARGSAAPAAPRGPGPRSWTRWRRPASACSCSRARGAWARRRAPPRSRSRWRRVRPHAARPAALRGSRALARRRPRRAVGDDERPVPGAPGGWRVRELDAAAPSHGRASAIERRWTSCSTRCCADPGSTSPSTASRRAGPDGPGPARHRRAVRPSRR